MIVPKRHRFAPLHRFTLHTRGTCLGPGHWVPRNASRIGSRVSVSAARALLPNSIGDGIGTFEHEARALVDFVVVEHEARALANFVVVRRLCRHYL